MQVSTPSLGSECIYLSPNVLPTPCCPARVLLLHPHMGECPSLPPWVVHVFTSPSVPPMPCCSALMWVSTVGDGCIYLSPSVPKMACCSTLMQVSASPSHTGWCMYLTLAQCAAHALLFCPHVGECPLPPALGGGCIYLSPSVPPTPCCSALIRVSFRVPSLPPWVVDVFTSRLVFCPHHVALPSCG